MLVRPITVLIKPGGDGLPYVVEPTPSSKNSIEMAPITWDVFNYCSDDDLWIQFQGFQFSPSATVSQLPASAPPLLFGISMSFGRRLAPFKKGKSPLKQSVETQSIDPATPKDSEWQYSIVLINNKGMINQLDPIVVLSGDAPS
jgi:hypothetical protein